MITDEDVVQLFRDVLNTPINFAELGKRAGSLQIYRGKTGATWKDTQAGVCQRQMTIFNQYSIIPKHCFECYKVLIAPRTVVELFKLLMLFEKIELPLNNTRKCMVECRDYCSGAYKGYIYCRGLDEAKDVAKLVRKAVAKDISSQITVSLKRGCSEYDQAYPGFEEVSRGTKTIIKYNKDWQAIEDAFDREFVFRADAPESQAAAVDGNTGFSIGEIYGLKFWLRYAATIGDMSYMKLAGMVLQPISDLKRPPFRSAAPIRKK